MCTLGAFAFLVVVVVLVLVPGGGRARALTAAATNAAAAAASTVAAVDIVATDITAVAVNKGVKVIAEAVIIIIATTHAALAVDTITAFTATAVTVAIEPVVTLVSDDDVYVPASVIPASVGRCGIGVGFGVGHQIHDHRNVVTTNGALSFYAKPILDTRGVKFVCAWKDTHGFEVVRIHTNGARVVRIMVVRRRGMLLLLRHRHHLLLLLLQRWRCRFWQVGSARRSIVTAIRRGIAGAYRPVFHGSGGGNGSGNGNGTHSSLVYTQRANQPRNTVKIDKNGRGPQNTHTLNTWGGSNDALDTQAIGLLQHNFRAP